VRRALGEVRYRVDGTTRWHENLTRAAVGAVKRDTRVLTSARRLPQDATGANAAP
jgi:hypothetical protein